MSTSVPSLHLDDFDALLFDVDKTLTRIDRTIAPRTLNVLSELVVRQKMIGICSGRHYSALFENILPFFPTDAVHITAGGAQIITTDGKVLWERFIPAETSQKIFAEAERRGFGVDIPNGSAAYGNQIFFDTYGRTDRLQSVLQPIKMLPDWAAVCVVLTGIDDEMLTWLKDHVPGIVLKDGISSTGSRYVDITAEDVTKATGLHAWSQLTQISPTKVIGFGDANNDLEFLNEVGWAVAMENSTDELKSLADRIIGHTDQDGLAIYIEALLKGAAV